MLENHVRGTNELAEESPDDLTLVVWPENASDIDWLHRSAAPAGTVSATDLELLTLVDDPAEAVEVVVAADLASSRPSPTPRRRPE